MKRRMNKFFSILLVLCMVLSMIPVTTHAATPGTLYFVPNSNWKVDGARFAAYFYGGSGDAWASMTDSDGDGIYECAVPSGHTSVIFCRMDPNGDNVWGSKWNQTNDLTIPTDGKNCYTVAEGAWDYGDGSWSAHSTTSDFYLFGYINGANYACEEDAANLGIYKFVDGELTATFDCDSYIGVKTSNGAWYMTEGYQGTATSVTLISTAAGIAVPEKMFVPGGIQVTFTLSANTNGTMTLSYTMNTSTCQHLFYEDGACRVCGKACTHSWSNSTCTKCGATCSHTWSSGKCTTCGISCSHSWSSGKCSSCGMSCTHKWSSGKCSTCGLTCTHTWSATTGKCSTCSTVCSHAEHNTSGKCTTCGYAVGHSYNSSGVCSGCGTGCTHSWSSGTCSKCGMTCAHSSHTTAGKCSTCGLSVSHTWSATTGKCTGCGKTCSHSSHNTSGKCTTCGYAVGHSWSSGKCSVCGLSCTHKWSSGKCSTCGMTCSHSSHNTSGKCTTCGSTVSHSYTSKVTAPTCTAGGYTTYICSSCGYSYTGNNTSATGHSWASTGKCSTCGTACEHNWNCSTCKTCGYKRDFYLFGFINGANYACEEDSANLGSYKFTSNKLTVTFTSDSYVAVKTSDNASWYMTEGYDESATSATLINTAAGIASPDKVYVPGGIQVTFTITENSNDTLTLKYSVTTSSCQHLTHSTDGKCTACGAAVDHSWSSGECSVCGKTCAHSSHNTSGKCTTCGMAVDHSYTSKVTAPTCTAGGYTTYTCSVCAHSYTGNTTSATGHSWASTGKCSTCGTACEHSWNCSTCKTCGYKRDFYLFGFINGANYACEEDSANLGSYKFTSNKLTVTFTSDSYVAVKTSDNASWYMTEGYDESATSATLINTAAGIASPDKVYVPGGIQVTFTITENSNDTLTLKYTVTTSSCQHLLHNTDGTCTACGTNVGHDYDGGTCTVCGVNCAHKWSDGSCTTCGLACTHSWSNGKCATCGLVCSHNWSNGTCATCGTTCAHTSHTTAGKCDTCGIAVNHSWNNGTCSVCGKTCSHSYSNGVCTICGYGCTHSWSGGTCTKCGTACTHSFSNGSCTTCGLACTHSWSDGTCGVCGQVCSHSYSGNTCTVCGYKKPVTNTVIYFSDTLGWKNVVGYPWVIKSDGSTEPLASAWPGDALYRNADGYYVLELDYVPTASESIGLIFHNFNGAQTTDLTVVYSTLSASNEIWVKPNNYAGDDGKYACTVSITEAGILPSPEVNGNQVTFRYLGDGSAVYLAGSFNDWSTTANQMVRGSDGVFSTTVNLADGAHEYKFVVDGEWIADPRNGVTGGYDGNSIVTVGDGGSTTSSTITIQFHFYRESGDYDGWDIWAWDADKSGSYTLTADPISKGMVATMTTSSTTGWFNYIVRKSDWSDQEFYDRAINLTNVKSGTVHFFLNSGSAEGSIVLGNDVVTAAKPISANLDYDSGKIWVKTPLPVTGDLTKAFSIVTSSGGATGISVTGVTLDNYGYTLTLSRKPTLIELHDERVKVGGAMVGITTEGLFYSSGFASDYTYYGDDLGATWSSTGTTFKVWAPTATGVSVIIYGGGNYGGDDWISTTEMKLGEKGVYSVTVPGDLHGKYYNYLINFPSYTVEANDPYARSTGANGDRGMILNLDATDPAGWDNDVSPNVGMSYTDAIIYEMHIREMTIDSTSGVKDAWRGKFLGMTQTGTNYEGRATGLDHLKELGITHVQLMPVYDFASIDEYHLTDWQQYGWGYDPEHYNVPEGSYSTDPFNGEVRVNEFKEMVQTFHENGINVVMDVVYNHTFSGGDWCYNKIVPNYFSRFYGEYWSNGSGCGNDLATERSMARNYIVDSILYWVEEYHIDGFRFDLAGLIDTQTINEITSAVHAKYPYVIFYGEGWASGGTAVEYGYSLTTKDNAWMTGSMGFYNDTFRNDIAGDNGNSWGFATGDSGKADAIGNYFRASNGWSGSPSQTINYVSAHDNYTLIDKIIISRNGAYWDQMVKMNNLSAAIYMLASGIPYIYSGEELLREKVNEDGYRIDNAHGTNDYVNKIRWDSLVNKEYAQVTDDYYGGLIEFRKNHAALRCNNGSDAWGYTSYHKINDHCILFYVNGYPNYECSDGIVIIYNAQESTQWVNIYDYGVPYGNWQACIHGTQAGVNPLWSTSDGSVGVEGLSTTVLVLGDLVHEESVYNNQSVNCDHGYHNQSGLCWDCGAEVDHSFVDGYCSHCNVAESATGTTTVYYDNSASQWDSVYAYAWTEVGGRTHIYTDGWPGTQMTAVGNNIYAVTIPCAATNIIFTDNAGNQTADQGIIKNDNGVMTSNLYNSADGTWSNYVEACAHPSHDQSGICTECGVAVAHSWSASTGKCTVCSVACAHSEHTTGGICTTCGAAVSHSWSNGKCDICDLRCDHTAHGADGNCTNCGYSVGHAYYSGKCSCGAACDYYLIGYINGANYGYDSDEANMGIYKFADGKLTATFTQDSYVAVKTTGNACFYMAESYCEEASVILKKNQGEKLFVPGGIEVTFTLTVNADDTLTLSYTKNASTCNHNYSAQVTTEATCTTAGVKTYTCSICGGSYTESIAALGHSYESVVTAPTCTEGGYTTYTCALCGDSYTGDATAATGHSYVDGTCTACGAADPDAGDMGYVLVTDASQITSGGKFVIVANNSGSDIAMGTTLSSGKFTGTAVTVDGNVVTGSNLPVWTIEGVDGGIALSVDGSYLAYNSSTNFKMATSAYTWTVTAGDTGFVLNSAATSRGIYYYKTAAKFGAYSTSNANGSTYISQLQLYKYMELPTECSHSYTSQVTTEATCETAGVRTYTCSLCGDSYTESIAALGHSYESVVTAPTCTDKGYTTYTCSLCGDSYTGNEVAATGHSYDDGVVTLAPSCDTAGVKTFTCSACGDTYTEEIASTGHAFVNGSCINCHTPDPDFNVEYYLFGWINGADYACEGDDDNLGIYKFVDGKLTVTFNQDAYVGVKTNDGNWFMTNGPTGTNTVARLYKTTTLGNPDKLYVPGNVEVTFTLEVNWDDTLTLSYVVAACEHSYSSSITTAPTCDTAGVRTYTCSKCGDSYTEEITSTGHTYMSGSCIICGEADPNYVPVVVPTITLKTPTLLLEDTIKLNIYYTIDQDIALEKMGMLTWSSKPDVVDITTAENVYPGATFNDGNGFYGVNTDGIPAQNLGDIIYFCIYAELADGSIAYGKQVQYSPVTYAYNQLKGGATAEMKALLVAILNYGAAAQTYLEDTDALVNANLTDEAKALVKAYNADMVHSVAMPSASKQGAMAANGGFSAKKPSISLDGAFSINYYFTPSAEVSGDMTFYYWNAADFAAVDVLSVDNATGSAVMTNNNGEYSAAISGIAAKDIDSALYACGVYTDASGNTYSTGILPYSLGFYCGNQVKAGGETADLAAAIAVYGYYAAIYFAM